jgi:hypothetical protein
MRVAYDSDCTYLMDRMVRLASKVCNLAEYFLECKIMIFTKNSVGSLKKCMILKMICEFFMHFKWSKLEIRESDQYSSQQLILLKIDDLTSWTRSIFLFSHKNTAGKSVSQSRYELSTTKLIAAMKFSQNIAFCHGHQLLMSSKFKILTTILTIIIESIQRSHNKKNRSNPWQNNANWPKYPLVHRVLFLVNDILCPMQGTLKHVLLKYSHFLLFTGQ